MALKDRVKKTNAAYISDSARRIIEDHLYQLRKTARTKSVSGVLSLKYRTNLYGLYKALNIPPELWWITTRVNNFTYATNIMELSYLAVPDSKTVDNLIKINSTKQVAMF